MNVEDRRVVLTREELYERVWSTPMRRLAGEFGLSDVGLAKICKRHKIPRPSRGYWAKKRNGKKAFRHPLPKVDDDSSNAITMSVVEEPPKIPKGRPPLAVDPEIARLVKEERDPKNKIALAKSLQEADPYIIATQACLEAAEEDEYGRLHRPRNFKDPCFDLRVSRKQASRSLRILHALVQALVQRGYTLVNPAKDNTEPELEILGHRYRLSIWETSSQHKRTATKEDRRRMAADPWYGWRDYEYRPTGCLEFCIDRSSYGSLAKIREASGRKLETRLNEIVVKLLRLVDKSQVAQERAKIEQAEKAARKKVAIEREIVNRMDEVRIAWIDDALPKWEAAQRLRPFIDAIRETVSADVADDPGSELAQWLTWATDYVESLDPLSHASELPKYSLSKEQLSKLREQCESDWCDYSERFYRESTQDSSRWNALSMSR